MDPAVVHTVSADQFITMYAPAFATSWPEAIGILEADPVENEIIEMLTVEAAAGRLREPVVVNDDPEIGDTGRLLNGMHRTIACLRTGTPIRYRQAQRRQGEAAHFEVALVMPYITDAEHDLLDGLVRSFPVDEHWWVSTDSIFSIGDQGVLTCTVMYDIPAHLSVGEAVVQLNTAINRRVQYHFPHPISIEITPVRGRGLHH